MKTGFEHPLHLQYAFPSSGENDSRGGEHGYGGRYRGSRQRTVFPGNEKGDQGVLCQFKGKQSI